nr:hypothetical protein Itr_chr14CG28010 [Ipomoea trifida]
MIMKTPQIDLVKVITHYTNFNLSLIINFTFVISSTTHMNGLSFTNLLECMFLLLFKTVLHFNSTLFI